MRLKVQQATSGTSGAHEELVSAVGWNAFNELYSCSDDKTVCRWDMHGDAGGKVGCLYTHAHTAASHRFHSRRARASLFTKFTPFYLYWFFQRAKKQKKNDVARWKAVWRQRTWGKPRGVLGSSRGCISMTSSLPAHCRQVPRRLPHSTPTLVQKQNLTFFVSPHSTCAFPLFTHKTKPCLRRW
jgi:hypothetical protein